MDLWVLIYCAEMFTVVRDRDQDPLFPIVPVPFPVPFFVPVPCSVNEPWLNCNLRPPAYYGHIFQQLINVSAYLFVGHIHPHYLMVPVF